MQSSQHKSDRLETQSPQQERKKIIRLLTDALICNHKIKLSEVCHKGYILCHLFPLCFWKLLDRGAQSCFSETPSRGDALCGWNGFHLEVNRTQDTFPMRWEGMIAKCDRDKYSIANGVIHTTHVLFQHDSFIIFTLTPLPYFIWRWRHKPAFLILNKSFFS